MFAFLRAWVWRNIYWRLKGERCVHDSYFRGTCRFLVKNWPRIGGRELSRLELQALSMAPAGSTISVRVIDGELQMTIAHPDLILTGFENVVYLKHDQALDEIYLYIDLVMFDGKVCPEGFGAVGFLRCAEMAYRLGFSRIELLAAGGADYKIANSWSRDDFNGYYSWARFGFNAELHSLTREMIKNDPGLSGCNDLADIIGRQPDWWWEHGGGGELTFDLQRGSRSWQTLYAYLESKDLRT